MPATMKIPTDADGLKEVLASEDSRKELLADPENFEEFVGKYMDMRAKKDPSLQDQIAEQVQKVAADMLRDAGVDLDGPKAPDVAELTARAKRGRDTVIYNPKAEGAAADGIYDDSTEFFQSIWRGHGALPNGAQLSSKLEQLQKIQNNYSSVVPSEGGFLIPETLRAEIMATMIESSVTRQRARVIPMSSLTLPIPTVDATSNVNHVFGGIIAYWTEEGATLTKSEAKFGRVVLRAHKLTAYAEIPNELLADSVGFSGFFDDAYPQALAWFEDLAFITGGGVGEPLGWLNAPASVTVAKGATAAASIEWLNIVDMYARMLPSSLGSAVWIVSPDTFPELATMSLDVGTGGSAIWINNGVPGPPATILGRPVIISEKVPVLGTVGDINFVDLSHYLIGDRQQMQAMQSEHFKFDTDEIAFRLISRTDGRPWLPQAITPHNNGPTLSPFVKLETRA